MSFSLYLRNEDGDHFLQRGATMYDLQKSHATIQRWISQMGHRVQDPSRDKLVIADHTGWATLEARYNAGARRRWEPITSPGQSLIKLRLGTGVKTA